MKKLIFEILFTSLLFLSCCYIYKNQKRIAHNDGKGYDGFYYYQATKQIQEGNYHISGVPPFVNRYANHFIIGEFSRLTGNDILDSAYIVNIIGMFITVILLLFWLRQFKLKIWIRLTLIFVFIFTWFVPIRNTIYEPMVPDPWGAVFLMAGLLLLNHIYKRYNSNNSIILQIIIFSIFVSIGTLFRESNIVLAIALFLIVNPFKRLDFSLHEPLFSIISNIIKKAYNIYWNKKSLIFLLPLICYFVANILVSSLITTDNIHSYSYPKALVRWFYTKTIPAFFTGTFIAYGPLLIIIPFFFKHFKAVFVEREYLSFLLFTAIFFGYFGGGDTERILFMSSFPFIFIMIGVSIDKLSQSKNKWWLFTLFFLQTFAMRLYWNTPQHPSDVDKFPIPFFGLIGEDFQYLYLFSNYGSMYVHTILLLEYCLLLLLTLFILRPKLMGKIQLLQQ